MEVGNDMTDFWLDTLGVNLHLHSNVGATDFWLDPGVEGFDSAEFRVSEYDKPGEDGSNVSNQLLGSRLVNLPGYVRGADPAAFEANRRALLTAASITRDNFGFPVAHRCVFTTLSGTSYFFDALVNSKPVFTNVTPVSCKFLLQLTTPDPLIYGNTQVVSSPITRPTGGGFVLPVILPIVSSSQTGGSVVVANPGTATVKPVITITGPLSNPYISNAAADGKYLQLNATLNSGDVVTVDMAEKTIVLNGSSNYLATRTSDSEWWGIAPGNNTISFSTAGTSDSGTMQVSFYPGYVGV